MTPLAALLRSLADLTAKEPRPEAQATAAALRAGHDTAFPQQLVPALTEGIRHSGALPDALLAARLMLAAHSRLPWQDSPIASLQPTELRAVKSVATLLGPGAPIPSDSLLFGLYYQAPGSYYPLHAHTAAETYTILAGSAAWQAGDRHFTLIAGQASYHPPNLPHAMRAGPDGFLAMWRWSGDIAFGNYRMVPEPEA
jgi:mannose-6-phosphate isomerase-like protein (cupin superfamily)